MFPALVATVAKRIPGPVVGDEQIEQERESDGVGERSYGGHQPGGRSPREQVRRAPGREREIRLGRAQQHQPRDRGPLHHADGPVAGDREEALYGTGDQDADRHRALISGLSERITCSSCPCAACYARGTIDASANRHSASHSIRGSA